MLKRMRAKPSAAKKSLTNAEITRRKISEPPKKTQTKIHRTRTIKFLTLDETKRLFAQITDKRDKAIFLLAYRHGLRASEIGLLRVSDLDLKRLRIMLHRLKGSLSGEHPLQADEARTLKAWLRSKGTDSPILFPSRRNLPISRQMLDVLMKRYGEEATIPKDKRHFHVLKHSIATHLLDAGAELRFLQDWLGHSNIQNTVIYTALVSTSREAKARQYFLKLPRF
jgi:site-specific recombinase XerD